MFDFKLSTFHSSNGQFIFAWLLRINNPPTASIACYYDWNLRTCEAYREAQNLPNFTLEINQRLIREELEAFQNPNTSLSFAFLREDKQKVQNTDGQDLYIRGWTDVWTAGRTWEQIAGRHVLRLSPYRTINLPHTRR